LSNRLFTAIKVAISVGLMAYLLTWIDLRTVGQLIVSAKPAPLLVALLLYFLAIGTGVVKWQWLLRAQGLPIPLGNLLAYTFVGLFFGNFLPSNVGGDVIRAYNLARHSSQLEEAATSVFVDRLIGLLAFLAAAVIMAILAAIQLQQAPGLEEIVLATIAVFATVLAGFALLLSRRITRRGAFLFDLPLLSVFRPSARRVFYALQSYRHNYLVLVQALALSSLIVVLTTLVQFCLSEALGLQIDLFYFFLFNPLIAFVLLVPITVNGIGLKETAFVFFLGLVGVPQAAALSISLLLHLIIILTSLPGGFLWWRQRGLRPETLSRSLATNPTSHPTDQTG